MNEIDAIRQMEADLKMRRAAIARGLGDQRRSLGLSLRQVGRSVRLSPVTIHEAERGKTWSIRTVTRISRFYQKKANAQAIRA